jgi:hypothetical protein
MKPRRFTPHVYDSDKHDADTACPQKWFWCRIHWWPRFSEIGEKWYEPYPLRVNRKVSEDWVTTEVHCGPGTFYPKPIGNRSYHRKVNHP